MTYRHKHDWLNVLPYEVEPDTKDEILLSELTQLTLWHKKKSTIYRNIIQALGLSDHRIKSILDFPFLPVSLFKEYSIKSIEEDDVFKIMMSSGTSAAQPSKIYLDRYTANLQSKILSRLMKHEIGSKRLPMLILDDPHLLKSRHSFTARGAAILGFGMYASEKEYALTASGDLDLDKVSSFFEKYKDKPVFLFGFTFIVWEKLVLELKRLNKLFNLPHAILLHGGGWKKMKAISVDNMTFKEQIAQYTGIQKVINYYGMVEQTGSLFFECNQGYLHCPTYSEIIIRRLPDLSPANVGETGIIQTLSVLPASYPGHSLLTDDMGTICGTDSCKCGRRGTYFLVHDRVPMTEVRGCSDAN